MKAMIFDIDSVLVDVRKSYNIAIKKTAEFFLGKIIDISEVYDLKLKSGYNDDWDCAEVLIKKKGKNFSKQAIIKKFQEYYKGRNYEGLIKNEKLIINKIFLKKLAKKNKLAIFTGRPRDEAEYILKRFGIRKYFKYMVAMEDVKKKKPEPEGLNKLKKKFNAKEFVYIGDSVDDMQAAKSAGVNFIGVIPPYGEKDKLKKVFKKNNVRILTNVNQIIKVFK